MATLLICVVGLVDTCLSLVDTCLPYESWHIWMSHGTHMNESWHIWLSHGTHMNESWHMSTTTLSYVGRIHNCLSHSYVTSLIHTCHDPFICDRTHSCVTWLMRMCNDKFLWMRPAWWHMEESLHIWMSHGTYESWHIRMNHMCHDSCIYVPWLMHICAMTHAYTCQDFLVSLPCPSYTRILYTCQELEPAAQATVLPTRTHAHTHTRTHAHPHAHRHTHTRAYIHTHIRILYRSRTGKLGRHLYRFLSFSHTYTQPNTRTHM